MTHDRNVVVQYRTSAFDLRGSSENRFQIHPKPSPEIYVTNIVQVVHKKLILKSLNKGQTIV